MESTFVQAFTETTVDEQMTLTENGAITYANSGSSCITFYSKVMA